MTMLCAGQSWNQIVEDMECSRAMVKPAKRFKEASGAQSTPLSLATSLSSPS